MIERLGYQGSVDEYWRSGGILDKVGFDRVEGVLTALTRGEDLKQPVNKTYLLQARHMSEVSNVAITEEQKCLYSILRGMTSENIEGSDTSSEMQGTCPLWSLCDQQVLAEVIRFTDIESLDAFINTYPNILANYQLPK